LGDAATVVVEPSLAASAETESWEAIKKASAMVRLRSNITTTPRYGSDLFSHDAGERCIAKNGIATGRLLFLTACSSKR
jgi:hypothetical protein